MPNSDPAIHRKQAREYYQRNKETICAKKLNVSPERKAEIAALKRQNYLKHAARLAIKDLMPSRRLTTAKSMAKKRGHEWLLTLEQYIEIIKDPCYYCANELGTPVKKGSGLDRMDSERGYSLDNVVSCCAFCNGIKSDKLTPEEMKVAVKAILDYRKGNKDE